MVQSDNIIDPAKIVTEGGKILNDNATEYAKLFNFDAYSSALADIISSESTDTPLTIGIFGDWGSGKTSLMSTIKTKLEENDTSIEDVLEVKCVWFNAWEQSFGQGGMLTTGPSLLYHIYKELDEELKKREDMAAKAKKMGWKSVRVVFDVLLRRGGNITLCEVEDGLKDETIYPASLADIFHDAIKEYIKLTGCGRVVVFIDDMDRCLPESAVEVLETIKLFLNAEHCIFVLGVDRRVITESIRFRYKDFTRSSKGAESPITGDDYLEKIIQLSFQLPPIRPEDIEGFIKELDLPKFYERYIKMISKGIEQNPRKVKRFLNNLELQRTLAYKIKDIKTIMGDETKRSLYEALLIEWAIINSYYPPPIRNDLLREPILLAELHEYVKRGENPLFNWGAIPGDDNEKLVTYLMEDHGVDWAKDAEISKTKDGTIYLHKDERSAEITIDHETKKASLTISGSGTRDLNVKEEGGKQNIYVGVSAALEKFLKSGVGIENLKKLIREFPSDAKLPQEDDVERVIHLSQATETPTVETKAEKVMTKYEILDAIKNKKDLKDVDMSNVDLREVDLSAADLRGVNMSGADLSEATLKECNLSSADLSGANLSGADLSGASLIRANLQDVNLNNSILKDVDLKYCKLQSASLEGTDMSGADARDAEFHEANLKETIFENADLRNAKLSKTYLIGVKFSNANLSGVNLSDAKLSKTSLRQLNLSSANLSKADLSGASLTYTILRNANLDGCVLKNADLRHCTIWYASLVNADLSDADLRDAEFYSSNMKGAIFENAKLKNTSLASANLSGAKFKGAEFSVSNLDRATLDGADFVGADLDISTRMYSLKKARWRNAKFEPWVKEELIKSST